MTVKQAASVWRRRMVAASRSNGGVKAAKTIKKKHGQDFYKKIGALGGATPTDKPKGFAAMTPEQVSAIGKLGGKAGGRGRMKGQA